MIETENNINASNLITCIKDNPKRISLPRILLIKIEVLKKRSITIELRIKRLRNNRNSESFFNWLYFSSLPIQKKELKHIASTPRIRRIVWIILKRICMFFYKLAFIIISVFY